MRQNAGSLWGIGSVVVTLGVTGLVNLSFLAPPAKRPGVAATDYGFSLGIKLAFFVTVLGFAGLNRFVLVPRLADSASLEVPGSAIRA